MQFSVMYVKMTGVNNDSGVVHSEITRCQVQRYCPKENVWCGVTILFFSFFFFFRVINYLDMIEQYVIPQL